MNIRHSAAALTFLAIGLGWGGSIRAQYVQAPAVRYYQPAPTSGYPRAYSVSPQRRYYASPSLPYNRSPYTDDWSTGRHLPYPKPWMLPTRDPAYRGR